MLVTFNLSIYISYKTTLKKYIYRGIFFLPILLKFTSTKVSCFEVFLHNFNTNLNLNVTIYYITVVFLNFKNSRLLLNCEKLKTINQNMIMTKIAEKLVKKWPLNNFFGKLWFYIKYIYIVKYLRWRTSTIYIQLLCKISN